MSKTKFMALFVAVIVLCWPLVPAAEQAAAADNDAGKEKPFRPEIIGDPEIELLDTEGAGKLYRAGEHLVCVMEGTYEEMGYQHGRLLADLCKHGMEEGYMVKALWVRGYTPEYVAEQSKRMAKHIPPQYIEEMKGVAEGLKAAGMEEATFEKVLIGVTQAEILHFDPDAPPDCSNFACWGKWTTDGRLLHGRNLDWNIKGDAQDDAVVMVWRPKGGTPFMMLGWSGSVGSVTGMSANGITIGEMTCMSPDATFDGMPLMIIMRHVLENATSLEQAIEIMKRGPRTTGWNFVIGDADGPDGCALEVDADACTVFRPLDPKEGEATGHWAMEDAVRRTNHPVGKVQLEKLLEAFGDRIAEELGVKIESLEQAIPLLKFHNTWQRYNWLGKQIQQRPGAVDVKVCTQLLATPPVGNDATLHSTVMDPENNTAYVAIAGNNPPVTATKRAFTKIDLSRWFKQ